MFDFERRWAGVVMSGFAPIGGPGLAPSVGEVDWVASTERFLERASLKGRLGVRLGVVMVMTAPLWLWGRLTSAGRLAPVERARLLHQLLAHRVFAIRELSLLLKLVGCMALFRVAAIRDRSGYDPRRLATPTPRSELLVIHPKPLALDSARPEAPKAPRAEVA